MNKTAASQFGDRAFKGLTLLMALSVFVLIALIGYELAHGSKTSLHQFGWRFLISSEWDPVNEKFGALPFIFGTLVSSAIGLIIAVPLSIATAVYLTELAPLWIRQPLTIFIELLAAVPSVILGLWGIFVMVPWLRGHLFPLLQWFFSLKVFVWTDWHLPVLYSSLKSVQINFFQARFTAPACLPAASSSPS